MDTQIASLNQLALRAADEFEKYYGRRPRWLVAAPGRVNLIGEHTDYNDGFVLPMAIDRYAIMAAAPSASAKHVALQCATTGATGVIDLGRPQERGDSGWINYVRGVIAGFQGMGAEVDGCDLLLYSNIPLGGGLSSSAALEVATATLLEAMTGRILNPVEKAVLCQRAEHEFAGVPCGIMDQCSSVMGRQDALLLLDCRSRHVEWVPFADRSVSVLIINSKVKHALTDGGYAKRRSECETAVRALGVASLREATIEHLEQKRPGLDAVVHRRARHVIGEIARTIETAAAVRSCDWVKTGDLMHASHESLRDDFQVSCGELDLLVELGRSHGPSNGVIGSRMTGGGFGGCTVNLVRTDAVESVTEFIREAYRKKTQIEPAIFVTRPAAGARNLSPHLLPDGNASPAIATATP